MKRIQIVLPECSQDEISNGLRKLTEAISKKFSETLMIGFLGGEFGMGCQYENDVFSMHPDYQCDPDDDPYYGKPHFKHLKSGFEVEWYKWIGRSMEFNRELLSGEWKTILAECIDSINNDDN